MYIIPNGILNTISYGDMYNIYIFARNTIKSGKKVN